jgi:hypothetical protein
MSTSKVTALWVAVLAAIVVVAACAPAPESENGMADGDEPAAASMIPKPAFNAAGELERPIGYRSWIYVGTPLTPNELNPPEAPFPEFHNVYIHPDDFAHWEETGTFQQGTVLVKELVLVGSTEAVSGNGYFMGEFTGLEATIKDAERYPDEPGNWAYYTFGHTYPLAETAAAQPTGACNVCHDVSADDDWVFTQYYPILSAAKGGATAAPAEEATDEATGAVGAASGAATGADVVPTDKDELFSYLQAGTYKSFAREAEPHTSVGPHPSPALQPSSNVVAFFNSPVDASLKAGNATHPKGAAIVKEFYDPDGQLSGWAVSVKTAEDSQNGQSWYWYEVLSTTDGSDPVAAANGVALCAGCHSTGKDFVLSKYP